MTAELKDELVALESTNRAVRIAELSAIVRFTDSVRNQNGRHSIVIELDTANLARKMAKELVELFGVETEVSVLQPNGIRRVAKYQVKVLTQADFLVRQLALLDNHQKLVKGLPPRLVVGTKAEAQAVWRGAFLARGTLTDPGRSAALEISVSTNELAMALSGIARRQLEISNAKVREVRDSFRVVLREGDAISAMLVQIGAHTQVHKWEELRVRREVRATANRLANFDDANLRRSAQAAVAAGARVGRALEILGDAVPEHLRYAGELRLQHKQASLDELGHLATPPMSKDAIAGRIRRLLAMADRQAAELGIPATDAFLPEGFDD